MNVTIDGRTLLVLLSATTTLIDIFEASGVVEPEIAEMRQAVKNVKAAFDDVRVQVQE
jgi:hypothetical protein